MRLTATARRRSPSASECERPRPGQPLTRKDGQRQVPLSNESINKTLVLLANILDAAVEREASRRTRHAASAAGSKRPAR